MPFQGRGWSERAFLMQHLGLEMSAGTAAAPLHCLVLVYSFWLLQEGVGAAKHPKPGAAAPLCRCMAQTGVLPSVFPTLGKEKWTSPSDRTCVVSAGEGTSYFLLATQSRAEVVLHFLCCQRGSGTPSQQAGITPIRFHARLCWAESLQDPSPRDSRRQEGWSLPCKVLTLKVLCLQRRAEWQ